MMHGQTNIKLLCYLVVDLLLKWVKQQVLLVSTLERVSE